MPSHRGAWAPAPGLVIRFSPPRPFTLVLSALEAKDGRGIVRGRRRRLPVAGSCAPVDKFVQSTP